MLTQLSEIQGYSIDALDKVDLGHIETFYFDDSTWIVRYFVINTGSWLSNRQVLMSPVEAGEPQTQQQVVPIQLKMQEIQQAPEADLQQPVSHQHEQALAKHYGWTPYWEEAGSDVHAGVEGAELQRARLKQQRQEQGDPNLRDLDEVTGYHLQTYDEEIGRVEDFIAETATWTIRYVVVNTGTWLSGRQVLISPYWIDTIDWTDKEARLELTADEIRQSPEYDPAKPIERDYEIKLHEHYGRPKYWE